MAPGVGAVYLGQNFVSSGSPVIASQTADHWCQGQAPALTSGRPTDLHSTCSNRLWVARFSAASYAVQAIHELDAVPSQWWPDAGLLRDKCNSTMSHCFHQSSTVDASCRLSSVFCVTRRRSFSRPISRPLSSRPLDNLYASQSGVKGVPVDQIWFTHDSDK
ncbi:hypothetical protein AVEN_51895-1 [Araneus ventricosus]|uniref:Uncharacterized protein n=1 Tax=Araneus ventricosus TaxID=182803 RepID=A0A4Y2VMN1_ARAVE|nr:hypothetical protein AVEN_51895-1 [Araneus ventricosus]